jgi:Glycosyl hydrolase family 95 catalytic domain
VIDGYTQFPRYWMNYNFEAPFYGVASANHPDLIEPYDYQEWAELPWQINYTAGGGYAGEMFTRSLAPFHRFMPAPAPAAPAPVKDDRWTDQKSNGGFAVLPSIFYYEYTHDQVYLRDQLYPTLRAVDAFFRDYLTWDGTRYVMAHSSAHEASDDLNPNLDLGFIRRVETLLISYSQQMQVDLGMIPIWQNTLARLAAYPTATVGGQTVFTMAENINGSTDPAVTFSPGDQPINMEGTVFPGENLAVGGDPVQLQIARNTLQQMNSWGVTTGENKNNGFPKEFPIAARVGWPAADLRTKLDAAIKAQWRPSNLTVAQSGGGIETSGTIEAVDSMLMQSVSGTIRLYGDADWPVDADAHFKRLRAVGGFEVSAALAGGQVSPVTITSDAGQPVALSSPWPGARVIVRRLDAQGRPTWPVPSTLNAGVVRFATAAGQTYLVSPLGG